MPALPVAVLGVMQSMNERQLYVMEICKASIALLEEPEDHTFSPQMEVKLIFQLNEMIRALDPDIYMPTYARAVLDSHSGAIVDKLAEANYEYSRIRKKGRFRGSFPNA